ncbi:MAG: phosphate ABC transporter ATP-binding protein, partial [Anaerolineae bacterium]|nr:phosphate ABC transporter ATP-binding protein [Anaerolineae bacterium]
YCLDRVTKQYQDRIVLKLDHLEIQAGEILAVVGPSGAGKSTLLRLLNFLEQPTSGAIFYNGKSYRGKPPLDVCRQVTTVFQNSLLLNRSVAANIAYGLKLRGRPYPDVDRAVTQALEQVGLTPLAGARARSLSGGETQRVALARALVIRPQVLLLDEPTANLDPANVKLIEQIISEVNQKEKVTTVLVTHNIFQAKRLAHRTALLLEGRWIEVTDTPTFFDNPADERTAGFVRGDLIY